MTDTRTALMAATDAYQALLEGHRGLSPTDDTEMWEDVTEDLERARKAMEVAWLNHAMAA
jgi:hypothetical protein